MQQYQVELTVAVNVTVGVGEPRGVKGRHDLHFISAAVELLDDAEVYDPNGGALLRGEYPPEVVELARAHAHRKVRGF